MTARVVLVSGASQGIGAALAERFATRGDTVIGIARRPVDEWAIGVATTIDRRVCDIADESAVKRLFSELRKQHGHVDVLVNNAGAFSGDLLLMAPADRFAKVLAANLLGAHVVTREAVKLMRAAGSGRVVSISSIAARLAVAGNGLYGTAKNALEHLMRDFAVEFRGSGVTFNSVEVSFVEDTSMVDALRPEARAKYEERLLVSRAVSLEEVAGAVEYLASTSAGSITGQVISLGSPF